MARKTSTKPTKIWTFSCRPPTEGADLLRETLFRARRYYNQRIEIERDRLARYREIRRRHCPELAAAEDAHELAEAAVLSALSAIKETRKDRFVATGTKAKDVSIGLVDAVAARKLERDAAAKVLKLARATFEASLKPAREAAKARRDAESKRLASRGGTTGPHILGQVRRATFAAMKLEEWPQAWVELEESDAMANEQQKALRERRDFGAGTGGLAEAASTQATADARPAPPKFRPFTGEGRVGGQVKPMNAAGLWGGSDDIQLRLAPQRDTRRGREFCIVRMNIGSAERGAKCWVELPVRMHRQLPTDAVIKYAWVKVSRVGQRLQYDLQLTLEADFVQTRMSGTESASIGIGWQSRADGVRVANWSSGDLSGDIVLPREIVDRLVYPDTLDGFAVHHFNEVKRALAACGLKARYDWVKSDRARLRMLRNLRQWAEHHVGAERLESLWQTWKTHRASRKRDLFAGVHIASRWARRQGLTSASQRLAFWLSIWCRKDHHLRQWAANQAYRARNQRDAFYRRSALELYSRFGEVLVSDIDIAKLAKRSGDSDENAAADKIRQAVAPAEFRSILLEVFGKRATKGERPVDEKRTGTARRPRKVAKAMGGSVSTGATAGSMAAAE